MTDAAKSHESRIRRPAERKGLVLAKARWRDPKFSLFGKFRLLYTNGSVHREWATLDEVADHLESFKGGGRR